MPRARDTSTTLYKDTYDTHNHHVNTNSYETFAPGQDTRAGPPNTDTLAITSRVDSLQEQSETAQSFRRRMVRTQAMRTRSRSRSRMSDLLDYASTAYARHGDT